MLLRMLCSLLLLLLAGSVSAQDAAAINEKNDDVVTFHLYDNGSSAPGVPVTLKRSEFPINPPPEEDDDKDKKKTQIVPVFEIFATQMSTKIEVSKYQAPKPVIATRAYREDGELIETFDQLKPSEKDDEQQQQLRRVYLVAEDLEFIWPYIEYGHQQIVSTKVLPEVGGQPVILESMSETPRVFRVWNMATVDEANAIIARALNATGDDALKRSTVGSGTDSEGNDIKKEDYGRTSENAWDWSSPAAKDMIKRSFQLTNIEEDEGKRDGLQVVRYMPGQGYNTHPDYFTAAKKFATDLQDFDFNPYSGGSNRFATVFMYLNEPEEGGSTLFPNANNQDPNAATLSMNVPSQADGMFKKGTWEYNVNNDCYNPSKLAVPPKAGTAALFYSITPDGRIDPKSHHAACPLIDGTKWGANIWIWNKQRFGDIRTGEPRTLIITNTMDDETVYIVWEGRPNGIIAPGRSITMNTFEFHRFKASFDSHQEKSFTSFTVQSEPEDTQYWEIEAPRNYQPQQQRRNTLSDDATSSNKKKKKKEGGIGKNVEVHAKNVLEEAVDILWQGTPLGIEVNAGDTVILNTFIGHTMQASLDNDVVSEFTVQVDKQPIWIISEDEEQVDEDEHDEL